MDLPDPGIKHGSPALQADSLPTELQDPALYGKFPLAICFTYGNVYVSTLLSQLVLPSSFHCVQILYVCVSIPALQVGSSGPFF